MSRGHEKPKAHGEWSLRMFPDWKWFNIEIFETQDPDRFWAECDSEGEIHYPGYAPGFYRNHFPHSFDFDNGRIVRRREFMNPFNQLRSLGIEAPTINRGGGRTRGQRHHARRHRDRRRRTRQPRNSAIHFPHLSQPNNSSSQNRKNLIRSRHIASNEESIPPSRRSSAEPGTCCALLANTEPTGDGCQKFNDVLTGGSCARRIRQDRANDGNRPHPHPEPPTRSASKTYGYRAREIEPYSLWGKKRSDGKLDRYQAWKCISN